jgi:hypothetical protein
MNPGVSVLIVVLVILILWLALLRNAMYYKPDFALHDHAEEAPAHVAEDEGH